MSADAASVLPRARWRFRFRWAYLIILAADIVFSVKFVTKYTEAGHLAAQVSAVNAQQGRERRQNERLRHEIRYYNTLGFVYQRARSWGYVRAGDRPVIVGYRYLHPARPSTPTVKPDQTPTWLQWWNAFFGGSSP